LPIDLLFLVTCRRRGSTLFPYTTLFRSQLTQTHQREHVRREHDVGLLGEPVDGGNRVESEQQVGGAQRDDHEEHRHHRPAVRSRSEEHTSELQSLAYLVCRLLLEKKKKN